MSFHVELALPDGTPVNELFPAVPSVGDRIELGDPGPVYTVGWVTWQRLPRLNGPTHLLEWRPLVCLQEEP